MQAKSMEKLRTDLAARNPGGWEGQVDGSSSRDLRDH